MFRSSRLVPSFRRFRSHGRPAVPGRAQHFRNQSSHSNGEGAPAFSRSTKLAVAATGLGFGLPLAVLCLAKWSPRFRQWLESNVPGSKVLTDAVLRNGTRQTKAASAADRRSDMARPAAQQQADANTAGADPASYSQARGEAAGNASMEPRSVAKVDGLTKEQLQAQDELEEQLRLAILEEERRVAEITRLEAEHEEQRKQIERDAQRLLEESVREAEERTKAEDDKRTKALQQLAEEEKEAARTVSQQLDNSLQNILSAVGESSKAMYSLLTAIRQHSLLVYKLIELQAARKDAESAEAEEEVHRALAAVQEAQRDVDSSSTVVDEAVAAFDSQCRIARKSDEGSSATVLSDLANQALRQLHATAEEVAECRADQTVMLQFGERMADQCRSFGEEMKRLANMQYGTDTSTADALAAAQSVFNSDIQSLLSFAQQRVESMQESLASGQRQDAEAVSALLLQQRQEDMQVAQLKLDHLREQLVREHQEELQKREVQFKVRMENDITQQLQRQAAAHSDHLRFTLEQQAYEMGDKYRQLVETALRNQTTVYQTRYHQLAGGMKGVASAVDDVSASVEQGLSDMRLCRACSSLVAALDDNSTDTRAQRLVLKPAVARLQSMAQGDAVIEAALASIPEAALEHGVQSQAMLQQRFGGVKKACTRVAFVGDKVGEAGFMTYMVAHLSSLLYWPGRKSSTASNKDTVDVQDMNVEALLQLADHHLNDGRLDVAVRLLNQLSGQPRVVAQDWIDEARLFLGAQQAVEIISDATLLRVSAGMPEAEPTAAALAAEQTQE